VPFDRATFGRTTFGRDAILAHPRAQRRDKGSATGHQLSVMDGGTGQLSPKA